MEKLQHDMEKDLEVLIAFNDELYDTYAKLMELEKTNKCNTPEFTQLIDRAKQIINLTSTIEGRIATNLDTASVAIKYLNEQIGLTYTPGAVKFLKCYGLPKDKIIIARIINNLNKKYGDSYIKKSNNPNLKYRSNYKITINNNLDLMILSKIKRNGLFTDETLSSNLYRMKYDMMFINTDLERLLIDANCQIEERPFIIRGGLDSLLGISNEESLDCEYDTIAPFIAGNMSLICKSDEELCHNKYSMAQAIVFAYGILSALLLTDNEDIINSTLYALKNAVDKTRDTSTFVIVNNLLEVILEDFEKDKDMYQFISFGGRKYGN